MSDIEKQDIESFDHAAVANASHKRHVDGDVQLLDANNKVQHVPIPTSSPRDPLNWSRTRKALVIFSCCWFSIMSLALVGNAGPLIPYWIQAYAPPPELKSVTTIINLTTWPSLFTGVGNWIFMPLALAFGRRFSVLVASVICLIACIGAGASKDFAGHMTGRIFQGLASGISEALLPLIIADITFVHYRARAYALYWTAQSIISSCFGISGSYLAEASGWRSYYWMFSGTCAFGLILNFFLIPETQFHRPAANIDGNFVATDAYGKQIVISEEEAIKRGLQDGDEQLDMRPLGFVESLKPWHGVTKESAMVALRSYWDMAKCLTAPALLWTVAYTGIVLGVNIAFSLTYASNLITSYGFKESQTGLIQIATIPSGILSTAYSGYFMDKLALRSARKNSGVHTPESRLPILIFPSIVCVAATVLYGYSIDQPERFGHHWIAPIAFFAMMNFAFVCSLVVSSVFAAEATKNLAGPALVIALGAKNLVSFGLAHALVPLVQERGGVYPYATVLGSATAAVSLAGIPIYYLNPVWRKWTSERS